jgi:Ca2+-binding RTX toxin-like protein
MADINGTNASETLTGTDENDLITPGNGDDTVYGGAGNDGLNGYRNEVGTPLYYITAGTLLAYGGAGDDVIGGKDGNDSIYGEDGDDAVWGMAGDDFISGGLGNDNLWGGDGNDRIQGGEGNDELVGESGDDVLEGGGGDDKIRGGAGNDTLQGGPGADELSGGDGDDLLRGEAGDDIIFTGGGNNVVYGGAGDDGINGYVSSDGQLQIYPSDSGVLTVYGGPGKDFIVGNSDGDLLFGQEDDDYIAGRDGNDEISGGDGDDKLFGDAGDDILEGGDGDDELRGGDGDDTLKGGAGTDKLFGDAGNDILEGGDGDDELRGGDGDDTLKGGAGTDKLFGDAGNDILEGGDGDDELRGGDGDDTLKGGAGTDKLFGDAGNDILIGGAGFTYLEGGEGNDTYYIKHTNDHINDTGGTDTAIVSVSFVKIPSYIEHVEHVGGALPLPYWIDTLIGDDSNGSYFKYLYDNTAEYFYTFPDSPPSYLESEKYLNGFKSLNETQKSNVRLALQNIETFADITFSESAVAEKENTLSFAVNKQTDTGMYAFLPSSLLTGSDVFIGDYPDHTTLAVGTGAAASLVHEIGHALGLRHPFGGKPNLSEEENQHRWTLMSYEGSEGFDDTKLQLSILDIAALHYIYGPNTSSRSGDDTYVFDAENSNFIWDGSGTDTIDASGAPDSVTIFLTPGYHGFIGRTKKYELITSPGQITVNFGTEIENLKGSAFADVLTGNHLDNVIEGLAGSDTIDGMEGIDTAIFTGQKSEYTWAMFVVDPHPESGLEPWYGWSVGEDSLRNIERLQFEDMNIALDLDGHAGEAVKTLGAFLGTDGITPENIGLVLNLLDNGLTYDGLLAEATAVVFGADPDGATLVRHFYTKLTGENAPVEIVSMYGKLIDDGELSKVELAKLVADNEMNLTNIDFVGLNFTGVEYLLG